VDNVVETVSPNPNDVLSVEAYELDALDCAERWDAMAADIEAGEVSSAEAVAVEVPEVSEEPEIEIGLSVHVDVPETVEVGAVDTELVVLVAILLITVPVLSPRW
jgi:hypothetical protein